MRIFGFTLKLKEYIPPAIYKAIKGPETAYKHDYYSDKLNSYSQYHEDILIDVLLKCKAHGNYIDIGANHPNLLSNTKRFYDRGWRGINIEPNPDLFNIICNYRADDINLNLGVGPSADVMPFYVMSADTLSSFDKEAALSAGKCHGAELVKVIKVALRPLKDIFKEHFTGNVIDLLSIDTEGYDYQVIASNDWNTYRPKVVIVETNQDNDSIYNFMTKSEYEIVFDNATNSIYVERTYLAAI